MLALDKIGQVMTMCWPATSVATMSEPLIAKFHFITRITNRLQGVVVRVFRRYFERAPGWVLLTTRGRKSGLPREVLLPCERFEEGLLIISTYGSRSNWL